MTDVNILQLSPGHWHCFDVAWAVMSWPAVKCQGGLDCVNRILQAVRVESRACAVPRLPEKHHRPLPCHNGRWYGSGWCFTMHHKYTVAAEAKVPYYLKTSCTWQRVRSRNRLQDGPVACRSTFYLGGTEAGHGYVSP